MDKHGDNLERARWRTTMSLSNSTFLRSVYPWNTGFISEDEFTFSITSHHCGCVGKRICNYSSSMTRTRLFCIINSLATDELMT